MVTNSSTHFALDPALVTSKLLAADHAVAPIVSVFMREVFRPVTLWLFLIVRR